MTHPVTNAVVLCFLGLGEGQQAEYAALPPRDQAAVGLALLARPVVLATGGLPDLAAAHAFLGLAQAETALTGWDDVWVRVGCVLIAERQAAALARALWRGAEMAPLN